MQRFCCCFFNVRFFSLFCSKPSVDSKEDTRPTYAKFNMSCGLWPIYNFLFTLIKNCHIYIKFYKYNENSKSK